MRYIGIENSRQYVPGVYAIKSNCGKLYIGSAVQVKTRFMSHRKALQDNRHDNNRLQNYYNKYGPESLTFETLAVCPKDSLINVEQYYIDKLEPFFNICRIAGATYGLKPWLGRKHTEETKKRIKETNISTGLKKKVLRWQKRSEKIRARMLGNKYWLGKKHKPETIANRKGALNPNSTVIYCKELGLKFDTVNDAAKYFGVGKSAICNSISRRSKIKRKYALSYD